MDEGKKAALTPRIFALMSHEINETIKSGHYIASEYVLYYIITEEFSQCVIFKLGIDNSAIY